MTNKKSPKIDSNQPIVKAYQEIEQNSILNQVAFTYGNGQSYYDLQNYVKELVENDLYIDKLSNNFGVLISCLVTKAQTEIATKALLTLNHEQKTLKSINQVKTMFYNVDLGQFNLLSVYTSNFIELQILFLGSNCLQIMSNLINNQSEPDEALHYALNTKFVNSLAEVHTIFNLDNLEMYLKQALINLDDNDSYEQVISYLKQIAKQVIIKDIKKHDSFYHNYMLDNLALVPIIVHLNISEILAKSPIEKTNVYYPITSTERQKDDVRAVLQYLAKQLT